MRGSVLLGVLLCTTSVSAADLQQVSQSTVYLRVTGTIADEDSSHFGAVCINTGTGFVISREGVVVTARHLIDDRQCELVSDTPGEGGVHRGRRVPLQITEIRASLGYSPEGQQPIGAVVVAMPQNDAVDAALLELNDTRLFGYRALRPCLAFLATGDEYQMYGYRGGGVLVPVPAQAVQDLPELSRLSLRGEAGPGMSGGPVISTADRPIALVVSGQEGDRTITYAVPMRYVSGLVQQRVGRDVPDCERRPSDLERVGLRLDRTLFFRIEDATENPESDNGLAGDAIALFERNRVHYAQQFLENERTLAALFGARSVRADNFYDSQATLFDALDRRRQVTSEQRVQAIRAYSANAFILAKVEAGLGALSEGLALEPASTALVLDLANRLSSYERPREVIGLVERRPDWLAAVQQQQGALNSDDFNLISLYARALWQRNEGEDVNQSYALYEQLLARVDVGTPAGLERRLSLLNDRFPLIQLRMDRPEQALAEMEEVWRGYRELYESSDDEVAARRRYDSPIAAAENNLANGYATLGRVAQARVYAASAVERRERATVVRPLGVATSLTNLGIMDVRLGEVERGLAALLEVDAFYQSFARFGVSYQLRVARLQREIGFAYLRQGDRVQARQRLTRGLRELTALNELRDDHYPRTLFVLGYYHLEGGELSEAVTRLREANAAARASDDQLRILIDIMLGEALVRREAGSEEGAILLRRAQEALKALPPDVEYVIHFSRRELRDRVNRMLPAQ